MTATASLDRRVQMLRTAMGPLIASALEDPDVIEVMLNPDRTLWVDRAVSNLKCNTPCRQHGRSPCPLVSYP